MVTPTDSCRRGSRPGGGGILAYIAAWIVLPEAPEHGTPAPDQTFSNTSMVGGLVRVAVGGLLLADQLFSALSWRYLGPVVLILFGGLLLARRATDR